MSRPALFVWVLGVLATLSASLGDTSACGWVGALTALVAVGAVRAVSV
jgi:hypothetical protein